MEVLRVAAAVLTASAMAGAQADPLFSEGFDDINALGSAGWVFTNASSPSGMAWFQGNAGVFSAAQGAAGSYVAANFNSSSSATGTVDNWLISPELSLAPGTTLSFYTKASDAGFLDLLEIRFSNGSGTDLSGFTTLLGTVGSAAAATYPTDGWVAVSLTLPTTASGRFAFHYSVANAMDASYIGVDSVVVSAVPEASTALMLGLGLAAVGAWRARRSRPSL